MRSEEFCILDDLPTELWAYMISYLDIEGLQRLRAVCRRTHELVAQFGLQYEFLRWARAYRLRGKDPYGACLYKVITHHREEVFQWASTHCPHALARIDARHVQKLVLSLCVKQQRRMLNVLLQTRYLYPEDFFCCLEREDHYRSSGFSMYLIHTPAVDMAEAIRFLEDTLGPPPDYLRMCTLYAAIANHANGTTLTALLRELNISIRDAFIQPRDCCLLHTRKGNKCRYKNVLRAAIHAQHEDALLLFYYHFRIYEQYPEMEVELFAFLLSQARPEKRACMLQELLRKRLQLVTHADTELRLYLAFLRATLLTQHVCDTKALFHLYIQTLSQLQLLSEGERCRDLMEISIASFAMNTSLNMSQVWRWMLDYHLLSPELLFPLIEECAQHSFWKPLLLHYSHELWQQIDRTSKPSTLERARCTLKRWGCRVALTIVDMHFVALLVLFYSLFSTLAWLLLPSLQDFGSYVRTLTLQREVLPYRNRLSVLQYYSIQFSLAALALFATAMKESMPDTTLGASVLHLAGIIFLFCYTLKNGE